MTLVEFLAARLAEDEGDALAACQGDGYRDWDVTSTGVVQVAGADIEGLALASREAALHMARHDPGRVLAEVEAKRRIIAECESLIDDPAVRAMETALCLLALPYADHPDYQPEWRP
jgi:hypothetical protein